MIYPTIGRVVWYYDHDTPHVQAQPALICYVHSPELINIGGVNHEGNPFRKTSVRLVAPDTSPPIGENFCTWMPYQITQAAKQSPDGKL